MPKTPGTVRGFAAGDRFQQKRVMLTLTQRELGNRTNIKQESISQFERGRRVVRSKTALRLVQALGFDNIPSAIKQGVLRVVYHEESDHGRRTAGEHR